jgi:hypothetical protein
MDWEQSALERGIEAWFVREIRNWDETHEGKTIRVDVMDRDAGATLSQLKGLCAAVKIHRPTSTCVLEGIARELSTRAANFRSAGKSIDAERTVGFLVALGRQVVQEYPDQAGAYMFLAEGQVQLSKNAWKQSDLPRVGQALSDSIHSLQYALTLDPDDVFIRQRLRDRKQRLADVPKS